jgi:hypothetical protein
MNRFFHDFHTEAEKVRLTRAERSRIQTVLRERMGIPNPHLASPFFIRSPFYRNVAIVIGVFCIIVGASGTAVSASEGSLPGDLLYPIKVGITEPIRGVLAFSSEAKAVWNANIAVTRLAEGEALATRGELTATTSAELAADFKEHAQAFTVLANDIGSSSPVAKNDLSAEFSRSVASKSAALLSAGKKNSSNPIALRASGDLVLRATSDEAGNAAPEAKKGRSTMMKSMSFFSVEAATTTPSTPSLEELSETAHAALANATSTFQSTSLTEDLASSANARAAILENLIVKAEAESALGSTTEAAADFTRAIEGAEDLENLVQMSPTTADQESQVE